jgi:hypothetical protein
LKITGQGLDIRFSGAQPPLTPTFKLGQPEITGFRALARKRFSNKLYPKERIALKQCSLGLKPVLSDGFFFPNLKVGVIVFFRIYVIRNEYHTGYTKNNAHFEPVFCIFIPNRIL